MPDVWRVLEWFAADDSLAGQAVMPTAQLRELQSLFGVAPNDPMYDCWPVGPAQAARVSELADVPVELTRFRYYVTAEASIGSQLDKPAAAPDPAT